MGKSLQTYLSQLKWGFLTWLVSNRIKHELASTHTSMYAAHTEYITPLNFNHLFAKHLYNRRQGTLLDNNVFLYLSVTS